MPLPPASLPLVKLNGRAVVPQQRNPAGRVTTPTTTDSGFDEPLTDDIEKQKDTGKNWYPPLGTNRYMLVPHRGYQSFPVGARLHTSRPAMSPQNPTPSRVRRGATPPPKYPVGRGYFICTAAKASGKAGEIPPPNNPKPPRRPACAARKRPLTISTMK